MAISSLQVLDANQEQQTVHDTDDPAEKADITSLESAVAKDATLEQLTALLDALESTADNDELRSAIIGSVKVDNIDAAVATEATLGSIDGKVATETSVSSIDGKVATEAKQDTAITRLNDLAEETTAAAIQAASEALTNALQANATDQLRTDVESISMPTALHTGQVTVSTAGTAVQLPTQATTSGVTIKALPDNAGNVFIGDSTVDAASGFILEPGERIFVEVDNADAIYVDASNSDDSIAWKAEA